MRGGLLSAVLIVVASTPGAAQTFGDGHSGPLIVKDRRTINQSAALTAPGATGDRTVTLSDTSPFFPGDSVLVLQSQYVDGGVISDTGASEIHRISRVLALQLEFDDGLTRPFPAIGSQVVTLPEYTAVSIDADAGLEAPPWNGSGGVLAFLVDGTLENNGLLDARGKGFRGGQGRDAVDMRGGCSGLDEPAPGGSERGEGLLGSVFGPANTGRRNSDLGGGGAVCPFSGGGGGAHTGAGGVGGYGVGGAMVGGQGGAPLAGPGLLFGGGGGASNGLSGFIQNGARGGGVIFVRARDLEGSGLIAADGLSGTGAPNTSGAGSGGGAGGTVHLEIEGQATCNLSATGGAGGPTGAYGPGGGGGGGYLQLRARRIIFCPATVAPGLGGVAMGQPFGATPISVNEPGNLGVVDAVEGDPEPPTPITPPSTTILLPVGCGCSSGADLVMPLAALVVTLRASRRGRVRLPSPRARFASTSQRDESRGSGEVGSWASKSRPISPAPLSPRERSS